MKKLLSLLLITALLCGCSQNGDEATTTTTTSAATTTSSTTTSATTTTANTTTSVTTTAPLTTTTTATTTTPEEPDIYANATDTAMPEAFNYNGGDENSAYFLPCVFRFDSVSGTITDLVDRDEFHEWVKKMDANKTPYDIEDYINVYSFMVYFNLPPEDVCAAIEKDNEFQKELADKGYQGAKDVIYTDEDLEVLKSGDKAKITKHFAREGSIVIGDKIFNPNWIYNHTTEDYETFGITEKMISEKIDFYRSLAFSEDGRAALETKFETFIDKDIEFSYVSPYTE